MYHHIKKLMYTVRVDQPDPRFGNMLLEQFGGANGELAAAMQYTIQGLNCDDMERKDMLMDIGTEELSHLEVVGTLARMHLKPMKFARDAAEADPLIAIAGGGGASLNNSMGNPWTADYLKITGELDVDLRSDIAAEARAKIVYERLINFCDDVGTKDALQFLMTREIAHMKSFTFALESLGKGRFTIGQIPPSPEWANRYFNDSTGEGEQGEIDARGPWNEGKNEAGEWEFMQSPVVEAGTNGDKQKRVQQQDRSRFGDTELLRELLVRELQDLYQGEELLIEALPKLENAARSESLKDAFRTHLQETRTQRDRLAQIFDVLGMRQEGQPSAVMSALIQEGDRVQREITDPIERDLALIDAAQKVEHHEMSGYWTARELAQQIGLSEVSQLLAKSMAEEENAASLLASCARPLMTAAKLVEI